MRTLFVKVKHYQKLGLDNFPSFSASGSIIGMKKLYYGKNALLIKCGGYVYNVDEVTYNKAKICF